MVCLRITGGPWFRLGEIYLNAAEAALELKKQIRSSMLMNCVNVQVSRKIALVH